jgi:hypothetical protein
LPQKIVVLRTSVFVPADIAKIFREEAYGNNFFREIRKRRDIISSLYHGKDQAAAQGMFTDLSRT